MTSVLSVFPLNQFIALNNLNAYGEKTQRKILHELLQIHWAFECCRKFDFFLWLLGSLWQMRISPLNVC